METLRTALSLLTAQEKKRGAWIFVLVIGMALLETVGLASVMPFLAVLGDPTLLDTNYLLKAVYQFAKEMGVESPNRFLIFLGAAAFALIIISAVYRTFTHYVMNLYIESLRHSISIRLLGSYLHRSYEFFLNRHSGDMSKKVLSEVDQLIGTIFRPAYSMFAYSLVAVAITATLVLVNPWLAFIAAGLLGGLYGLAYLFVKKQLSKMGQILVDENKERFLVASDTFGGIKDIKLLGCELLYLRRFEKPSKRFALSHANLHTLNQVPHFLIEAIVFGAILLLTIVMLFASGGLGQGTLGQILPVLGVYTFAAYRLKPAMHHVYEGLASLRSGHAIIDSLYSDLKIQGDRSRLDNQISLLNKTNFALRNVTYTYPQANVPSLLKVNIKIPINGSTGIVGTTGAGKTTFVDVILGLLKPTAGDILIDDDIITAFGLSAWQSSLGYVPQDIFLMDASILENIAFGVDGQDINLERVKECASIAHIDEFIDKELPHGYGTAVGERGVRLSGGQRQRIGIARALYSDPQILVLDEATSALDTVTESEVMKKISRLSNKKTIIIIAHRISSVKNCQQIVLLDKGKVKANGSYSDLANTSPEFQKLISKA